MNALRDFLIKYFHVFVFVVLLVLSIVLMYNSMHYQKMIFHNATQSITGPINQRWSKLLRHFQLANENEQLVAENLKLLREKENMFLYSLDTVYTYSIKDTNHYGKMVEKRMYDYFSANVVFKTTHKKHNYIIIDKGYNDGVTSDMAVLSLQGAVVGVVKEVSANFSSIIPLINPNSRTSAKVVPINQIGTVVWEDNEPDIGNLIDIPQHLIVNVGDSIFTSGYSSVFPPNLLIGKVVDKYDNEKNTFLTIKVQFATDFRTINSLFLIKNIYRSEIDSLKTSFPNE